MKFNPEDELVTGPRCRNCHKGSSGCGGCHNTAPGGNNVGAQSLAMPYNAGKDESDLVGENNNLTPGMNGLWRSSITDMFMMLMDPTYPHEDGPFAPYTGYKLAQTSTGASNELVATTNLITKNIGGTDYTSTGMEKNSRTVGWSAGWRAASTVVASTCSDDGLSWPHRTLGWKMLKDDLFGIDVTGQTDGKSTVISVGETRVYGGQKTHDLDSVCLDCHNPTIWNATSASNHEDSATTAADDLNDDLLLRGLP